MRTIPAVVALAIAFTAGWFVNDWFYRERTKRLEESRREAWEIANASAKMSQNSLNYALNYQATLDVCLQRMDLKHLTAVRP